MAQHYRTPVRAPSMMSLPRGGWTHVVKGFPTSSCRLPLEPTSPKWENVSVKFMGLLGANKAQLTKLFGHRWFPSTFWIKTVNCYQVGSKNPDISFPEKLQGYLVFQPPQGVYFFYECWDDSSFTLLNSKAYFDQCVVPVRCSPPQKKQHQSKIQSTSPHPRIPGKKWGWFLFGLPSWRHLFLNWFLLLQAMLRKSSEYLLIWSTILWYFSWHLSCEICSLHHTSETNQPFKNIGNIMKHIGPITQLPPTTPFPRWF